MNVAKYSLWYVGEGYHELIRDTKNGIDERHASNLLGAVQNPGGRLNTYSI